MEDFPMTPLKVDPEKDDNENNLTRKFLRGEISFTQYTNEWYGKDGDDIELEYKIDDADDTADVPMQLLPKTSATRRKKYTRLSTALLGLMGEANIRFVRGDKEMAEKMCYEIIRQVPTAPEPYQTLAQIYENDPEKSLQFSLLAAHLSPSDASEWLRLAAISEQKNDLRQVMICYTQAIKAEPQNLQLHLKRIELIDMLEQQNNKTYITTTKVKCYHKLVNELPTSEGELIMKYMKMAAKLYHSTAEVERALEVMASGYKKCAGLFTLEDINLFLELLIASQQYQTCIEVFVANVGVEIEAEIQTICENNVVEERTHYLDCRLPENVPVDLKSKLIICFIYLNAKDLAQKLLNEFFQNDVDSTIDLCMDIEEALTSVGMHDLALKVLEPLVAKPNFDLGAIWLKHAECLNILGRYEEAIISYKNVLKHAPHHVRAKEKLFEINEKLNRIEDALHILEQDPKMLLSAKLLYNQCLALSKHEKWEKFLEFGEILLTRSSIRFRHVEETQIARLMRCSVELIHNYRLKKGEPIYNDDDIQFDPDEDFKLTSEEEWALYQQLVSVAHKLGKYCLMQRISFTALLIKRFNQHRKHELDYNCLLACLYNKDHRFGWTLVREFANKIRSSRIWNMFNYILHCTEDSKNSKYIIRLFERHSENPLRNLFLGNNYFVTGRYAMALGHYIEYNEQFKDPLSSFLIALATLISPTQKRFKNQDAIFLQAFAYLTRYVNLRKCDQEAYYNVGRAYHLLSLRNLAIEYYERALACKEVTTCKYHGSINLNKEIAYNLYTLYKEHSPQIARRYMLEYLVI